MNYYEENQKLFPLQEGEVLVCDASDTSIWTKGREYVANEKGRIRSDHHGDWFVDDIPSSALFRRKTEAPANLVKGPPPEGVEADIYHVVTGPKVEVRKAHYHVDDPKAVLFWRNDCDDCVNGTETITYSPDGSIKSREYEWEGE